jgi:uncharacterized Zn finger protein
MALSAHGEVGLGASEHAWWSQRFLGLLESFGLGTRLERGRDYARSGRVLELDVEPGIVLAKVQGSRFTPYRVRIRPQTFSEYQWRRAEKAIVTRALTLAQLLAGEMPADIEDVLAGAKLALLPGSYDELRVTCTCPDAANPCKHTAAVYYRLAAHLDADPFALLALRGRTEEELLHALRARRAKAGGIRRSAVAERPGDAPPSARSPAPTEAVTRPVRPLAEELDGFWRAGEELDRLQLSPLAGPAPDALLRRLGPLAPLEGGLDLGDLLAPAYLRLAAAAERRALSS